MSRVNKGKFRILKETFLSLEIDVEDGYLKNSDTPPPSDLSCPREYSRIYETYGDITRQFLASNSR